MKAKFKITFCWKDAKHAELYSNLIQSFMREPLTTLGLTAEGILISVSFVPRP